MKSIGRGSIIPALAIVLIASAPPALAQAPGDNGGGQSMSGGGPPETDGQCRDTVRGLRSAYKDSVSKNGGGSFTTVGIRRQLDQAYGDCCRAHASRWSWCDAGGNVRTDRPDKYPYDPDW